MITCSILRNTSGNNFQQHGNQGADKGIWGSRSGYLRAGAQTDILDLNGDSKDDAEKKSGDLPSLVQWLMAPLVAKALLSQKLLWQFTISIASALGCTCLHRLAAAERVSCSCTHLHVMKCSVTPDPSTFPKLLPCKRGKHCSTHGRA